MPGADFKNLFERECWQCKKRQDDHVMLLQYANDIYRYRAVSRHFSRRVKATDARYDRVRGVFMLDQLIGQSTVTIGWNASFNACAKRRKRYRLYRAAGFVCKRRLSHIVIAARWRWTLSIATHT